jgi:hypothetical protein
LFGRLTFDCVAFYNRLSRGVHVCIQPHLFIIQIIAEKLKYACREFTKGHGDDEERLMRRIMIARRNNLKDHQTLKRARQRQPIPTSGQQQQQQQQQQPIHTGTSPVAKFQAVEAPEAATTSRRRRPASLFSDAQVESEMDISAVEATRSFRGWLELPPGGEFIYNQKYVKGKDGHDWLLRKNIWRRMRYRRENKKMVECLKGGNPQQSHIPTSTTSTSSGGGGGTSSSTQPPEPAAASVASHIIDHALSPTTAPTADEIDPAASTTTTTTSTPMTKTTRQESPTAHSHTTPESNTEADADDEEFKLETAAVAAAVAVAESYAQNPYNMVNNPLEAAANTAALDAAAQLAAAATTNASMATEEADAEHEEGVEIEI